MASNGNFSTNSYDGRYVQFNWSVASQSIANNNTTINWEIRAVGGNSSWYRSNPTSVYINGNRVYYNGTRVKQYKGVIASGSYTISHDNNGNASFNASVSSAIYSTSVNCNGSGSWGLPQIARQANITGANNFNDEQNPSFTFSKAGTGTLNVWLEPNPNGAHLAVRNGIPNNGSYTWNLTEDERNQLRQACGGSSCTCRIGLYTVINGTTFASYVDKTLTIVNANPTIEKIEYYDNNQKTIDITNNDQIIVRNNSKLEFTLTNLKALKYATLTDVVVRINGLTDISLLSDKTASLATLYIGEVNSSSNLTAEIVLTDSRGNSTTYTKEVIMLDWVQPSAIINCQRENNFYSKTYLTVDGNISSLNDKNAMTIQYQYKKTTDTDYSSLKTIQENTQTSFDIDNNYAWNIRVIVSDKLASTSYNLFVDKGVPIVYFDRLLSSMGINCFPKNNKSVEINGKTIFDMIYPVGSIYMSINSTSPSALFGGTWEQIKERFLLGADSSQYKHLCEERASFTLNVKSHCRFGKDDKWIEKDLEAGTYTANMGTFGGYDPAPGITKEVQIRFDAGLTGGQSDLGIQPSGDEANGYGLTASDSFTNRVLVIKDSYTGSNMPPYLTVYMWKRTA